MTGVSDRFELSLSLLSLLELIVALISSSRRPLEGTLVKHANFSSSSKSRFTAGCHFALKEFNNGKHHHSTNSLRRCENLVFCRLAGQPFIFRRHFSSGISFLSQQEVVLLCWLPARWHLRLIQSSTQASSKCRHLPKHYKFARKFLEDLLTAVDVGQNLKPKLSSARQSLRSSRDSWGVHDQPGCPY